MKKIYFTFLIGVFLLLQCVLTAKSESNSYIWIITDGPGIGIQVSSYNAEGGGTNISDVTFDATGNINPPDSSCIGDKSYYNGTLYGQADPGGCGWGHVINYGDASEELKSITDILASEEYIRLELKKEIPNFVNIKFFLSRTEGIMNQLLNLLDSKVKAGIISYKTYNKLKRSLKSVSGLDGGVNLNPSTSKEREKDIKKLSTAYDIKVRIVKQIVSLESLLKANP